MEKIILKNAMDKDINLIRDDREYDILWWQFVKFWHEKLHLETQVDKNLSAGGSF